MPDELLQGQDLERELAAALALLSERRRDVFLLIRYQGMSYRQAGEVLGITVQTVANHLSAALKELRRLLRDYAP